MTPADEPREVALLLLREAARLMRERAEQATRGPWVYYSTDSDNPGAWTVSRPQCDWGGPNPGDCEDDCGINVFTTGAEGCEEDNIRQENAEHIASMHPGVALGVADWLDHEADMREAAHNFGLTGGALQFGPDPALAVARAYLGREATDG